MASRRPRRRGKGTLLAAFVWLGLTSHCGSPPCDDEATCERQLEGERSQRAGEDDASTDEGGSSRLDGGADARALEGPPDGASSDAAAADASDAAHAGDAAASDAGDASDAGPAGDAATDAGDAGDAGADAADAGGGTDPNPGGCVSGAMGTHVARFRWAGSGANSPAYVQYEANNLPDQTRWKAGAYSRGGVGYQPRFSDTFLGAGGLEMGSANFIDVELSTAQLSKITRVTLSILGRSFSTGSSGSFEWMTFDGAGAAPSGLVSNATPYAWYSVDATSGFVPGNAGVLLRISPGAPSRALIVNKVELCFETR